MRVEILNQLGEKHSSAPAVIDNADMAHTHVHALYTLAQTNGPFSGSTIFGQEVLYAEVYYSNAGYEIIRVRLWDERVFYARPSTWPVIWKSSTLVSEYMAAAPQRTYRKYEDYLSDGNAPYTFSLPTWDKFDAGRLTSEDRMKMAELLEEAAAVLERDGWTKGTLHRPKAVPVPSIPKAVPVPSIFETYVIGIDHPFDQLETYKKGVKK
jgi:hypothetical protein